MRQIYNFLLICGILLFISTGCVYNYFPDFHKDKTESQIIINSLITPEKDIIVYLYETQPGKNKKNKGLLNGYIELYENETAIYQGRADSVFKLAHRPLENSKYRIKLKYGNKEASAVAIVPQKISSKIKQTSRNEFNLHSFISPSPTKHSIYIVSYYKLKDNSVLQFGSLYSSSSFIDNLNKEIGANSIDKMNSNIFYNGFIRISAINVPFLESIIFNPQLNKSVLLDDVKAKEVIVITASNEYDQYMRTSYKQLSAETGDEFSAFFYEPASIFSNIRGGIGIFAGYNSQRFTFPILRHK